MSPFSSKHIFVACAIIERRGLILATQRSAHMSMPLKWEFPGGKINPGESPEDCLYREIREELGIEVNISSSLTPVTHDYVTFIVTLYPYLCTIAAGEIILHEHAALVWITPEDLFTLDWAVADFPILKEYMNQFPDPPTVSVVIPVYNGGPNFRLCLASVAGSLTPPYEIIVVADGETDGSSVMAGEFTDKVVKLPVPGGPARARNCGAATATGDILFFVDSDVTVPRDAIGRVGDAFQKDHDLAALIGSYDDEPFETNFLSQYKNLFHHYVHQTSKGDASTFWGACGAIRREIFDGIQGFNEGYRRPCIEDIELGYRLKKAGFKIRLIRELQVKHLKRWTVGSLLKADFCDRALPWAELILKDRLFINDLNLKISDRVSVLSVYLLILAVLGSFMVPLLLSLVIFFMVLLVLLNRGLYHFFVVKRGISFTLKAIPWHWFYFCYSGAAFCIALARRCAVKLYAR